MSGQALGAAIAWNRTEFDFRQAHARAGDRDPEGAGKRQFQPAAKGKTIDAGDGGDWQFIQLGEGQLAFARAFADVWDRAAYEF